MAEPLEVPVKMKFDEAAKDAKKFSQNLGQMIIGGAKSGVSGVAGLAARGTANNVGSAINQSGVRQAGRDTYDMAKQAISEQHFSGVRTHIDQLGALQGAKERTIDQIGVLGTKISPKAAQDLFKANWKVDSEVAKGKSRSRELIAPLVTKEIGSTVAGSVSGGLDLNNPVLVTVLTKLNSTLDSIGGMFK